MSEPHRLHGKRIFPVYEAQVIALEKAKNAAVPIVTVIGIGVALLIGGVDPVLTAPPIITATAPDAFTTTCQDTRPLSSG